MAFLDKQQLGIDPTWRARCEIAGVITATDVMAESAAAPGHDLRSAYAFKFLNAPATMSGALAIAVAAQPGITDANATDQDIQFTCNSIWSQMSGYSPNP